MLNWSPCFHSSPHPHNSPCSPQIISCPSDNIPLLNEYCKDLASHWEENPALLFVGATSTRNQSLTSFWAMSSPLLVLLLFSSSVTSDSLRPCGLQHARLPCPPPTPGVCSNSYPLSQWRHPIISSSVVPFSFLQPLPASESFPMSHFFARGGRSIGASASVLPMNSQDWLPLELIGLI